MKHTLRTNEETGSARRRRGRRLVATAAALVALLATMLQGAPAWAAASLTIQPITWDIIGLDANRPATRGPDTFPVGVRVCNTGDATATNLVASFAWDSASTYIALSGPATLTAPSLDPAACTDLYFQAQVVTRSNQSFGKAREYQVDVSADGIPAVSTPTPRQLWIGKLNREQSNDHVVVLSGPTSVQIGQTYTYQLDFKAHDAGWHQENAFLTMPNTMFQLVSVSQTYTTPPGATNDKVYADACGWEPDPSNTDYGKCIGPPNYPGGTVGGNVTALYTVKVIGGGTVTVSAVMAYSTGDKNALHYNQDYGTGINLLTITTDTSADLSLSKSHADPFIVGSQGTYSISEANLGPNDASGPQSVTDTLPTGLTYVSGSGDGWTCSAAGQAVTCTRGADLANGASTSFPIVVGVGAPAVPQVTNQATVSSPTADPDSSNNTGSDVTPIDQVPVAADDSAATSQGVPVTIDVLANDSDPDGDALSVSVAPPPSNGSAVVNPDQSITYTPGAGFTGTDSFGYSACDPSSGCDGATVSILVPTAVRWEGGAAFLRPDGVHVAWHTGFEVDNLGFNVYRQDAAGKVRLTAAPVAGSALTVGGGIPVSGDRAYSFVDARGGAGSRYWVQDLDLSGRSTWHGPFAVGASPQRWATSAPSARSLTDLGIASRDGSGPALRVARIPSRGPSLRSVQLNGGVAVQVSVDHEGWYSVPLSALATLGLDTTRPAKLHVSAEGAEQAVQIKAGILSFYGLGLDTPATATRVYVVYKGTTKGSRVKIVDGSGDGPPAGDSFTDSVIRQDHTVYFASLLNGEASNFFGPLVSTVPLSQTIDVPEVSGSEGAQVEVSVQGVTIGHHSIQVDLNGVALGLLSFDGQQLGEASFAAPGLAEGSNEVTLTSASAGDYGLVGAISVTYSRRYVATGDVLRFTVGGGTRVSVSGFSDPGVRMVDVTNSASPVEVTPQVSLQGETYIAAAKIPGAGTRTVYAFAPAQVQSAAAAADIPSSLRSPANAADLVIITTADLAPSLAPLTALREQQGLKVSVVDVQDVYDEFSFSEKDPSAIQAFLSYARSTWAAPPSYVLMFGDGTYDPRGWLGGSADLIPIKLVDTTFMETASDTWFVDADSDGMADLPAGRIPVDDPSSAAAVVAKLVAYDASSAPASVVLAADQADGYDFPGGMDQLAGSVPQGVGVTSLVRPNGGNADLVAAVDASPTVVDYLGHGNVDSWAGAWLSSVDAPGLSNATHPALFVSMTCLNGYFTDPSLPSLGEALLAAPGGAVAVWGSTGLGDPASELAMNQALFGGLFDPAGGLAPVRLGDALLAAQRAAPNAGLLATGVLLGDPTMVLR